MSASQRLEIIQYWIIIFGIALGIGVGLIRVWVKRGVRILDGIHDELVRANQREAGQILRSANPESTGGSDPRPS